MRCRRAHPRKSAVLCLIFGVFFFILALKNSQIAANGIKKGIALATGTLIPSLFPFIVFSDLAIHSNAAEPLKKLFAAPSRFLFGLSKNGTTALVLGWLCGSPIGTVSAITLLKNGQISKNECDRLLLFSGTPSAGFLIGAVGTSLFGNHEAGTVLFLSTLCACALTGVFLKLVGGNLEDHCVNAAAPLPKSPFYTRLTGAVRRGFATLLEITGFVLFFSAVAECMNAAAKNLALSTPLSVFLIGFLELTTGVNTAVLSLPPESAFCLCAFFAGFGGLSICFQLFSIAEDAAPRLLPYLLARLVIGAICAFLTHIYLFLCKPTLHTTTTGFFEQGNASLQKVSIITPAIIFLTMALFLMLLCDSKIKLVTFTHTKK